MTMEWAPYSLQAATQENNSILLSWRNNAAYIPVVANSNNRICFKENVNELFAVLTADNYTIQNLAVEIAAKMTAASESGWIYFVNFNSASTHWTISCAHIFSILWNTGYYKNNDMSDLLGFADDHDDTGSASYEAESDGYYSNPHYDMIYIDRKPAGGAWDLIKIELWPCELFEDLTVEDGTHYYYRIRGYWNSLFTDYSNEADTWSRLPPPTLTSGSCLDKNTIKIQWNDNSVNEDGFKIWRNGDPNYATVGKNVTEFIDSGLTPATWYHYRVKAYNSGIESEWDWDIEVFTTDPPNAPSNLQGQLTATDKVHLIFQDNSSNETSFRIMIYPPGGPWSEWGYVGPNITSVDVTGLTQNTAYSFLVKARGDGGDSAYSNQITVMTMADIAKPTNPAALALSDTKIELTFQDNSNFEDVHCIERKPDGGSYAEVKQLEKNRTYWLDTGRTKGVKYWYRIRAKQNTGPVYSDYSDEVYATTISEPATPTSPAISEIQDAWMVLTWIKTSGETGYKIEKSTGGAYTEIAVIGAGIERFKVTGLAPSTPYWFKIRAYNAAGNSSYTSPITDTTLAQYAPSAFEILCRKTHPVFKFIGELNPIMELAGFALTGGKTYTYELEVQERGIDVETITENDITYTKKTSIADVESTASSFYFDYYGRKIYVHTSNGSDPVNFQMIGSFWLRFTNYSTAAVPTVYNENMYLCLMPKESIPDTSAEVKPYYEGNYAISSGTVKIINPDLAGWYWDRRFARYEFRNRKFALKLGGENFTYDQFKAINTGNIHDLVLDDRQIQFGLRDPRDGLARSLPVNLFDANNYPNLPAGLLESRVSFYYGTQADVVPVLIDAANKKYKIHDGRLRAVNNCKKNGTTTLAEDTDFYVDYQNGIIQLAAGVTMGDMDFLLFNIDGQPDSAGDLISNGAEIWKDICNRFLLLADSDLNLDSIYQTKYAFTTAISVPLNQTQSSDEVFRQLEHTLRAYTFQDEFGRIGIKPATTAAPSNVRYVRNHQIFSHSQRKSLEDAYYEVTVYYNISPKTHYHQWINQKIETMRRKTKTLKWLQIYTYLPTEAAAQALLNEILAELDKMFIDDEVGPVILGTLAGDIIKYSRDRFYNSDGTASELNLRILKVGNSFSGNSAHVTFTAEVVS